MRIPACFFILFLSCSIMFSYRAHAEDEGEIITISEKVGEVIDEVEREYYRLFPQISGFRFAVFLKLPDESYVAEVTYEEDGDEKKTRIPQTEQAIASLGDFIGNFEKIKLDLPKLDEEKPAVDLGKIVAVRTPFNSSKVVSEILAGMGAGALFGVGGGAIGFASTRKEDGQDFENLSGLFGAVAGFVIAYPIGSVVGVYVVGNIGNETGNPLATLAGGLVGVGAGIGAIAMGPWPVSFICPPVGATIGFNATRRYKNPPPLETGLINYRDGGMHLAAPTSSFTQVNTGQGTIITQNITLLQVNF